MWQEIVKHQPKFSSAVLTVVDAAGYPLSIRCKPELDSGRRVIQLAFADGMGVEPGSAGLLFHQHDDQMWNIRSFLLRGKLEREARGWVFRPQRYTPGLGIGGPLSMIRLVRAGRRTAQTCLRDRGLARPDIEWDEIRALYEG